MALDGAPANGPGAPAPPASPEGAQFSGEAQQGTWAIPRAEASYVAESEADAAYHSPARIALRASVEVEVPPSGPPPTAASEAPAAPVAEAGYDSDIPPPDVDAADVTRGLPDSEEPGDVVEGAEAVPSEPDHEFSDPSLTTPLGKIVLRAELRDAPEGVPDAPAVGSEPDIQSVEDTDPVDQSTAPRDEAEPADSVKTPPEEINPDDVAVKGIAASRRVDTVGSEGTPAPVSDTPGAPTAEGDRTDTVKVPPEEVDPDDVAVKGAAKAVRKTLPRSGESGRLLAGSPILKSHTEVVTPNAFDALRTEHVWDLKAQGPDGRGYRAEDAMAKMWEDAHPGTVHLRSNHPTIDLWNPRTGVMTSVKSLDPALPSYAENPNKLESRMTHYYDHLKTYNPSEVNGRQIYARSIRARELLLAIPDSGLTPAHVQKLEALVTNPKYSGIMLRIVEIPR